MRLNSFLNEDNDVQKGLSVNEPEISNKYNDEEIKRNVSIIKSAMSAQKSKGLDSDADMAIYNDLEDKLDKWQNVDKVTKPAGPNKSAEAPPEEKPEEAPPEEKPEEKEAPPEKEPEEEKEEEPEKKEEPEDDEKGQKDAEDKAKKEKEK